MRLPPLIWRLVRSGANGGRRLLIEQPMRGFSVLLVILTVWGFVFGLGRLLLIFLSQERYEALKPRLTESLLALFFFALFFLVALSNTIVVWGALYRNNGAIFHAQLPFSSRSLYWGAAVEGGVWSSWAGIVLALPLTLVLIPESAQPWWYLPAGLSVMIAFLAVCLSLGNIGATLLAPAISILRRHFKTALILVACLAALRIVVALTGVEDDIKPVSFLREAISSIGFTENPYLPPFWAQQGMTAALQSRWEDWLWYVALLASTATGISVIGEYVAQKRLRRDIDMLTGRPEQARKRSSRGARWRLLPFVPQDIALLVAKDLRLFRRDPAQLLQFGLYFGILTFYILLLPRIERTFQFDQWWRPVVSLLNLTAVAMALATFTGRFVFPLLSYEGKRMWILVLAPWPGKRIVTAKLAFALLVGLPVSVGLVILSGTMLELQGRIVAYQAFVTAAMGIGLSAGALGLGALLADYREDDAGKLAAGYGGTINLLLSLVFVGLLLVGAAFPLFAVGIHWRFQAGIMWILIVSGLWTFFGLRLAWANFGSQRSMA